MFGSLASATCFACLLALPSCATHVESRRIEAGERANAKGVVYHLPRSRVIFTSKHERVCDCGSDAPSCVDRFTDSKLGTIALPDSRALVELAGPDAHFATSMFDVTLSESGELSKIASDSQAQAVRLATSVIELAVSATGLMKENEVPNECRNAHVGLLRAKLRETDVALAAAAPANMEPLLKIRKELAASLKIPTQARELRCQVDPDVNDGASTCEVIGDPQDLSALGLEIKLTERDSADKCHKQADQREDSGAWRRGVYYRVPHWCTASVRAKSGLIVQADVVVPQHGVVAFLSLEGAEFSAEAKLEFALHPGTGALQHVKIDEVAYRIEDVEQLLNGLSGGVSTLHQTETERLKAEIEVLKLRKEKAELESVQK